VTSPWDDSRVSPTAPWHHLPPVPADVGEGFVATEAPAMQQSILSAMRAGEGKGDPIAADLEFASGAAQRVVVGWRNRYVGFVPTSHLASMRGQLVAAGKAVLTAPGEVYFDGKFYRVWVGVPPVDGYHPALPGGYDELPIPPLTIFGVPLTRLPRHDE
jgi:hypothetical protein